MRSRGKWPHFSSLLTYGGNIDNACSTDVDMQSCDEQRDMRRFPEALIAAGSGRKEGGKARLGRHLITSEIAELSATRNLSRC